MSDSDIIRAVLAGDHDRFGELVEHYFRGVYAICLSHTHNPSEAEEAVQEAFVRCYAQLHTLRRPSKFPSWLAAVARNLCRDSQRARVAAAVDPDSLSDPSTNAAEQSERRELVELVQRLVSTLPAETREAMFLYYLEDCSTREIGGMLGKSPAAVARLLQYGREKLRADDEMQSAARLAGLRPSDARVRSAIAAIPFAAAPWLQPGGAAAGQLLFGIARGKGIAAASLLVTPLLALVLWQQLAPDRLGDAPADDSRVIGAAALESQRGESEFSTRIAEGDQDKSSQAQREGVESSEAAMATEGQPGEVLVSGTVISGDGYPLAGASVMVVKMDEQPHGRIEATTDVDGRYRLKGVRGERDQRIYAAAKNHILQSRPLQLGAREHHDVDFTLPIAEHRIAGVVVDREGRPVVARIDLRMSGHSRERPNYGGRWGGHTIFTWSNSQGRFELGVSLAGFQALAVYAEAFAVGIFNGIESGTTDARLVLSRGGSISGRVAHADGRAATRHRVQIRGDALYTRPHYEGVYNRTPVWYWISVTDERGSFSFPTVSETASWDLMVRDPGVGTLSAPGETLAIRKDVPVEDGTDTWIDIVLQSVAVISGVVRDRATGEPAPGLLVRASVEALEAGAATTPWGEVVSGADGSYRFELPIDRPEKVAIDLIYMDRAIVRSAFENRDETVPTLHLTPGEQRSLDLVIEAPFTVSGLVRDDRGGPLASAPVVLTTYAANSRVVGQSPAGVTDAAGRFTKAGLDPLVSYQLFVTDPTQGFVQDIAGQAYRELGRSAKFTGDPGGVEEIEIITIVKGGIEGRLVDAEGLPLPGQRFEACALLPSGERTSEYGETDAKGSFVLLRAAPRGRHQTIVLRAELPNDLVRIALLEDVEIAADEVVAVGTLAMLVTSKDEEHRVLDEALR